MGKVSAALATKVNITEDQVKKVLTGQLFQLENGKFFRCGEEFADGELISCLPKTKRELLDMMAQAGAADSRARNKRERFSIVDTFSGLEAGANHGLTGNVAQPIYKVFAELDTAKINVEVTVAASQDNRPLDLGQSLRAYFDMMRRAGEGYSDAQIVALVNSVILWALKTGGAFNKPNPYGVELRSYWRVLMGAGEGNHGFTEWAHVTETPVPIPDTPAEVAPIPAHQHETFFLHAISAARISRAQFTDADLAMRNIRNSTVRRRQEGSRRNLLGRRDSPVGFSWNLTFEGRVNLAETSSIKKLLAICDLVWRIFSSKSDYAYGWGSVIVRGLGINGLARIAQVEAQLGLKDGEFLSWAYTANDGDGAGILFRALYVGEEIGCSFSLLNYASALDLLESCTYSNLGMGEFAVKATLIGCLLGLDSCKNQQLYGASLANCMMHAALVFHAVGSNVAGTTSRFLPGTQFRAAGQAVGSGRPTTQEETPYVPNMYRQGGAARVQNPTTQVGTELSDAKDEDDEKEDSGETDADIEPIRVQDDQRSTTSAVSDTSVVFSVIRTAEGELQDMPPEPNSRNAAEWHDYIVEHPAYLKNIERSVWGRYFHANRGKTFIPDSYGKGAFDLAAGIVLQEVNH